MPKRLAIVIVALLVVYGLIGHLGVPYWIETKLPALIERETGRTATVGNARFNPWRFTLTANDLAVATPEGGPWIAFGEIATNLDPTAALRGTVRIAELEITDPSVVARRAPDGTFGIEDLTDSEAAPVEPPQEEPEPWIVEIGRLAVARFTGQYTDAGKTPPAELAFGPLDFRLEDFSTKPDSDSGLYSLSGAWNDAVIRWQGSFSPEPLRSSGHIELGQLQLPELVALAPPSVPRLTEGRVSFEGHYAIARVEDVVAVVLRDAGLTVEGLAFGEKQRIARISVDGVSLDSATRRAEIGRVEVEEPAFAIGLDERGELDLGFETASPDEADEAADPAGEAAEPWHVLVPAFELRNGHIDWSDRSDAPPAQVRLHGIRVRANDFAWPADKAPPIALEFEANVQEQGAISVSGPIGIEPLNGALEVNARNLAATEFQPYIARAVQAALEGGVVNAEGRVEFDAEGAFGDFSVDVGRTVVRTQDSGILLALGGIKAKDLAFNTQKRRFDLARLTLAQPDVRLSRKPNGALNTEELTRSPSTTEPQPSEAEKATVVTIGTIAVAGGKVRFRDATVDPPVETRLAELEGNIKGLDSTDPARSQLDVRGQLDGQGEIRVHGTLRDLRKREATGLQAKFEGVGLRPFSAYARRYVGRPVDAGSLDLTVNYKLQDRVFRGQHQIVLDQFELGEKVESPDATKLPVRLALALLRDRKGAIDVGLPVRGDLDDSEFSYVGVILKAVVDLIAKVAASPFALLGNLVPGGGESLENVAFAPGSAALDEPGREQVRVLAKALVERPALAIDIIGSATADEVAPEAGNPNALATARGQAVADALAEFGLPEDRIATQNPELGNASATFAIRAR